MLFFEFSLVFPLFMKINDLNKKVVRRYYKEITIDSDNCDEITYIFPDTKEFIQVLNRKFVGKKLASEEII